MTWQEVVDRFLAKVMDIYNSNPKRREPGDGSDGTCDCIGLPIGAVRRMGLKWNGIHGSNWAARKEFVELKPCKKAEELERGDVVLKGCDQNTKGWALPGRYRKGGKYYNGDLTDYYHAGVVESVNPLRIRHMSSKMTTDTKIGKWNYHGRLRLLQKLVKDDPEPVPSAGCLAVVVAEHGSTVNLRKTPSMKGALIARVPLGTTVEITDPGEDWATIIYLNKKGYMKAEFLDICGDGKGNY